MPGEIEHRRVTEKTRTGVPLDRAVFEDLVALGRELGVEPLREMSRAAA